MISFFCFYNVSSGVQARLAFSDIFKHCNIITFDGETWIVHEFDINGIQTKRIKVYSSSSFIRGLKYIDSLMAMIVVNVEEKATFNWKPFLVRSCNEIDRYIAGVDIGFTFNPKHLYSKLIKNADVSNYEILYHWRR